MRKILFAASLSLIFLSCENSSEPTDTSNLLVPEFRDLNVSNDGVSFKWSDYNTLNVDFEIDRKIEDEEYLPYAKLDNSKYEIIDSTLPKGRVAYYRLRAVYKNRTSDYKYSIPVVRYSSALIDSSFQSFQWYNAYKLNNDKFLLIGFNSNGPGMSLIFDPATNQMYNHVNLPKNFMSFTFNQLDDGNVLFSGIMTGDEHFKNCYLYNPLTNVWSESASLIYTQTSHSSIKMPDGKIFITGGYSSNGVIVAQCELYDPVNNTWSELSSLPSVKAGHSMIMWPNGKIMVIGGAQAPGYSSNTCEIYDPASNTWSLAANLNEKRGYHDSYLLSNNNILVVPMSDYSRTSEVYDISSDAWTFTGERKYYYTSGGASTRLNDGRILSIGSYSTLEIYYPELNKWVLSNTLPYSNSIKSVVTTSDNRVYVFGGSYQCNVSAINLNTN